MNREEWLLCPVCKNKTPIKLRQNTIMLNFSLFCPKCKQETLVDMKQYNILVVKEPDAKIQSHELVSNHKSSALSF